ncbi:MAG: class I SAM-dependent methyltransferase [Gammaproteobacteria bacterium]|nr:class I SAM-dependent methyltransferase [Gammaproteobacteria bacterium]
MNARVCVKAFLSRVIPDSFQLRYLTLLPRLMRWKSAYCHACPEFEEKHGLYDFLNEDVVGGKSVDYLEFGVWYGATLNSWLARNKHSDSRFYGFDTFTGLPEPWQGFSKVAPAHTFTTHGTIPAIEDSRVQLIQGLFQNTLNNFLSKFTPEHQLIVHIDSDLYSSALFVLTRCDIIFDTGTIIIFDEFSSMDELRALEDYAAAYRRQYKVLGTSGPLLDQVAITVQ